MPQKNKKRKQEVTEPVVIRTHHEQQQGESSTVKEVRHGSRMDQVREGRLHRIHDKRVDDEEEMPQKKA